MKQEEDQQTVRKSRKRVAVATQATRLYRETFPELEIIIGNTSSSAAIIASLLRHGFDTSLVDFIGIETAAGQTGMPERLWQGGPQGAYLSRELTRRFGHDLLVTGCYEYTSHCDRHPGVQRRAEFYVRDALDGTHSWSLSPDGSLSQTTGGLPRFVPRRFSLRSVDDSERGPCLQLELHGDDSLSDLIGASCAVAAAEPVPIRGEPHTLGLWVKGNSSWGKVMFESEDAKGGNRRTHANQYHDWRGELSINFDGWHFIQFPLDAGPPHHPRISRRTMATSEGREWQRGPPHPADDAARRVEPPGAVSAREEQFPFLRAGDRSDAARRGRPRRARFSRAAVRSLAAGAAADMIVNQLVRGRVGLGPVAVVRRPILRNLRMRTSVVKAKLARNEPVLAVTVHFTDPSVAELASLLGFDCLWLDLEHHATSLETASNLIRASRVGNADVVARPAKGEFMRMGRLLETGAAGIMYPRCESAAEAAEVVKWAKFAPLGRRGVDGGNPDMPYLTMPVADYLKAANEQTFIVMQLEDSEAVARADEIAAVPGIDVLFLGVGDFTVLSGFPGRFDHPAVDDAVRRVASAAAKAGIHWGMPCFSPEHGRRLIDLGARFLAHSADLSILKKGLEQIRVDFAPLGCRFAPACNGPGSVTV